MIVVISEHIDLYLNKNEIWHCWLFYFESLSWCHMAVVVLWLFLTVPRVGLQYMIVAFPCKILHLLLEFWKPKISINIMWLNINYHFKILDFFLMILTVSILVGLGPTSVIFCRLDSWSLLGLFIRAEAFLLVPDDDFFSGFNTFKVWK